MPELLGLLELLEFPELLELPVEPEDVLEPELVEPLELVVPWVASLALLAISRCCCRMGSCFWARATPMTRAKTVKTVLSLTRFGDHPAEAGC